MNILDKIVLQKSKDIALRNKEVPITTLIKKLEGVDLTTFSSFKESLLNVKPAVIAEIKKASPSAGIIDQDFNPVKKAKEYEEMGATALSILTEERFFMGSDKYLQDVKRISKLPILRKDFIISEYQIYESKLIGADCILLIASILDDDRLLSYSKLATELNLDFIIEVHDQEELDRAIVIKDSIIGVNNRNLKTFEVDINNSISLRKNFEGDNIFISESGIKSSEDIKNLMANDISAFLIGESLMKNNLNLLDI
ncbi:MAG: indole-3-glycerol phosphate synthase TrpC [Gammaproteobacteria bacterium]